MWNLTNRQKRLAPKRVKFWCWGCDAQIVTNWKKCPVCGTRNHPRKLRK